MAQNILEWIQGIYQQGTRKSRFPSYVVVDRKRREYEAVSSPYAQINGYSFPRKSYLANNIARWFIDSSVPLMVRDGLVPRIYIAQKKAATIRSRYRRTDLDAQN